MSGKKSIFLFILLVIFPLSAAFSQGPYSIFGIGSSQNNAQPQGMAMGGVFAGLRDSVNLNFLNPASYSAIDITQLQLGFETNIYNRKIYDYPYKETNTNINQILIGVPIIRKKKFNWGMTLGYMPFSQVKYNIYDTLQQVIGLDTMTVKKQYDGSGGINRVFWGNGFRVFKGLSVGFNVDILFGTSNRNASLVLPPDKGYLSTRVIDKTSIIDVGFDFGVQYDHRFRVRKLKLKSNGTRDTSYRNYSLVAGATYTLGKAVNAELNRAGILYLPAAADLGLDTFFLEQPTDGFITLPNTFAVGLQLSNMGIWKLNADFQYARWSEFRYFGEADQNFYDSYIIAGGLEYKPYFKDALTGKMQFFKNMIYRAGLRYHKMPFRLDANPVEEVGFSVGLGLPIGFSRIILQDQDTKNIFSYINIGFEGGLQRSSVGNAINDTFFRLNVALTLRDLWFVKRKFN